MRGEGEREIIGNIYRYRDDIRREGEREGERERGKEREREWERYKSKYLYIPRIVRRVDVVRC